MKTERFTPTGMRSKTMASRLSAGPASSLLSLLLLLAPPAVVPAQVYTWTTNNGTITITSYNGGGGDVLIPSEINGRPVTSIGDNAFYQNMNLSSVTIPDSVITIGAWAFGFCPYLSQVTIGNRVTTIGERAFSYCPRLTTMAIPDSVSTIGDGAFEYSSLFGISLGSGLSRIGDGVFEKSGLISLIIPDTVKSIGTNAFAGSSLVVVMIGTGVSAVADGAFGDCPNLRAIVFEGNAPRVGQGVFESDTTAVVGYLSGTTGWGETFGGLRTILWNPELQYGYTITNQTVTITEYGGPGGPVNIPDRIEGLPVTSIGDHAFARSTYVTGVTIPDSVTNLGDSAFANCGLLTSVKIPDSVLSIGSWVFVNCGRLTSITIGNSVSSIADYAFDGCGVTNIVVPGSVTNIGNSPFGGCTSLTGIQVEARNPTCSSLEGVLFNKDQTALIQYPAGRGGNYTVPDTVTSIRDGAFELCPSLTSVVIPDSVITIGAGAFHECYPGLTGITLGNRVVAIGEGAFNGCNNLARLVIPSTVTSIGNWAFVNCNLGEGVYFEGDAPSIGPATFDLSNATLYYLPGTMGWGSSYSGRLTAPWLRPDPVILTTGPSFGVQRSAFGFRISWATNASVVVEASSDLTHCTWLPLQTNALVGGWVSFADSAWTNYATRFYRVRSP